MPKRSGRKRKTGAREPNGRISRVAQREADTSLAPSAIRALLASNLKIVQSQEYGTPVGRLMLEGSITPIQWSAAKMWDRIARDYQLAINAPPPDPRAQEMHAPRQHPPDPESAAGERQAEREGRAVERFREARDQILEVHGHACLRSVREVCEGVGRPPAGYAELIELRRGLSVLVAAWHLSEVKTPRSAT